MTQNTHPVCNGRTIYTADMFKSMVENRGDHVITAIFNKEMAVVRQNVKEIFRERALMDSYVAQMLGWDKTHYSKWMSEPERNLSLSAAAAMSNLVGCSLNELVMGEKKPIRLPRTATLLYSIIKSRAALHAVCDKMLSQTPKAEIPLEDLVYSRLEDRADDLNEDIYQMVVKWNAELKQVAFKLLRNGKYIGRLPMIYAICVCTEDSPDYLLRQNISSCDMTADGKEVEARYRSTIGTFMALARSDQENILADLVYKRYF